MNNQEIEIKLQELRKLYPSATHQGRELLKRRARALELARRKNA